MITTAATNVPIPRNRSMSRAEVSETCRAREMNERETDTKGIGVRAQFVKKIPARPPCSLKSAVFDYSESMSRIFRNDFFGRFLPTKRLLIPSHSMAFVMPIAPFHDEK